ncbi:uncharacterized protein inaF-D [Bemisia tabaci]|uniref:uncharacterized protein inaF-D n=1 Tax=Bemisia tabaci TaxID=7038 RepID=UPI0008F9CD87|nr:PREDICTED: uncharacterized protein LOC109032103 [Bemisia tabaci]
MEENPRKSFSPIRDAPSCVMLAGEEAKDKLYEPKNKKKLVRVLTVIAYMFSVSLAAIMLSLYYMFLWSPRNETAASQVVYPPCQIPDPIVMERLSKQIKQQQGPVVITAEARPTTSPIEKQSTKKINSSNHHKHQKNKLPEHTDDEFEMAKIESSYSDIKHDHQSTND